MPCCEARVPFFASASLHEANDPKCIRDIRMAGKAENDLFRGVTNQQRGFVLAIINALAKYSSEDAGQSSNVPPLGEIPRQDDSTFSEATDLLISETVRLDYALRTVGSGGPGMERANVFRNLLRDFKELVSDSDVQADSTQFLQKIIDIDHTTDGLHTALEDFIGITFNERLMESMKELRDTLQKHYTVCASYPYGAKIRLKEALAIGFLSLQKHLEKFVDEDVRTIKSVQNDANQGYVNLTVIATFLSGVTASVLQIVGPTTSGNSVLAVAVNACLFSSLVFSTASAAQSLLAMMWMQSFVRLPEKNLPHLLYAWLHRGPLISLLASGALFAVGLIIFVYSSKQDAVTSAITTCFATFQTVGVLSLTILFIRDRWRFRRESGITGLKLTKFSILFSSIEWIERSFRHAFPSSSTSQGEFRRYKRPPSFAPVGSFMKPGEEDNDPNIRMQPSPASFHEETISDHYVEPFVPDLLSSTDTAGVAGAPNMPWKRPRGRYGEDYHSKFPNPAPGTTKRETNSYLNTPRAPGASPSVAEIYRHSPASVSAVSRFSDNSNQFNGAGVPPYPGAGPRPPSATGLNEAHPIPLDQVSASVPPTLRYGGTAGYGADTYLKPPGVLNTPRAPGASPSVAEIYRHSPASVFANFNHSISSQTGAPPLVPPPPAAGIHTAPSHPASGSIPPTPEQRYAPFDSGHRNRNNRSASTGTSYMRSGVPSVPSAASSGGSGMGLPQPGLNAQARGTTPSSSYTGPGHSDSHSRQEVRHFSRDALGGPPASAKKNKRT